MFKAIEINNKIAMVFPDYYEVDIMEELSPDL